MLARFSALATFVIAAFATTVTVNNDCNFNVDPAFSPAASGVGGFSLTPGASQTVTLPEFYAGIAWGRTDCDANGVCGSGTCPGGLNCTGAPSAIAPPTFAHFTINFDFNGTDTFLPFTFDGFNMPMTIGFSSGCDDAPVTCVDPSGDGNQCNQASFCPTGTDYTLSFC